MPDYWDEVFGVPAPTPPPVQLGQVFHLPSANGDRERAYALGALRSAADELAATAVGRNGELNRHAFKMAGYVKAGTLTEAEVVDALTDAGRAASSLGDHPFTEKEIRETLRSALGGGARKGLVKTAPLTAETRYTNGNGTNGTNGHHVAADDVTVEEDPEELQRRAFDREVNRKIWDMQVRETATSRWTVMRAEAAGQLPPPVVNLTDMLAIADEPARFRVDGLWPVGGRVLLAAQYKAGKTTLMANLLRTLVDGHPFLGQWAPQVAQRVTLIDTELDERMLRTWLREQGIINTGAINVISMRGRLSTFNILDDQLRAGWADRLAGTDILFLDCLRPCLDALGLSEDKDAGRFLVAFDALVAEAAASEALVVHHMGHSQERSRGDSRLLDWPDVLWKIVRDTDDDGNQAEGGDRYFSAMGRDVNVAEAQLDYTHETRSLMVCGGGRAQRRARTTVGDIERILALPAHSEGLSHRALVAQLAEMGVGRNAARDGIKEALSSGLVVMVSGPRNADIHILNPSRRQEQ